MAEFRFQRVAWWSAAGVLAAVLAVAGYWLLFTTFMLYDDEGYVLLSLQNFSRHGALYDGVYTQYGPFPYLFYDALHRIFGFGFDNVSGRWITLVNWIGAAAGCGLLVARTTRSIVWSALTLVVTFTHLWIMINEPVHPGGLIACLVAISTWCGAELWSAGRIRIFAGVMGFVAAAFALTKINVGIFFAGAVFVWLVVNTTPAAVARRLNWVVAIGCALLPFVLMRSLFEAPWVRLYALVFSCTTLSLLLIADRSTQPLAGGRAWVTFFIAGAVGTLAIGAAALARGTTLHAMLDGVVFAPLKHPGVYFFAMNWRIGTGVLAIVSLGFVAWTARRRLRQDVRVGEAIAWARLLAGAIFLCTPLQIIPTSLAGWGMSYGISLAWLFAIRLGEEDRNAPVRLWVALVLVFQFLQGYPVAGSQINWGSFLWVPLMALGICDAVPRLRARLGRWESWTLCAGRAAVAFVALFTTGQLAKIGWERFTSSQPLGLPGAETLRLPNDITSDFRVITENLRAHADLLFSFPGTFSANLWTQLPAPTLANATHWFSLLNATQQQRIIDRLASAPRAALLVQRDLVDYLARNHFPTDGPLHTWLMAHFEPKMKVDGYEIWLRNGRSMAALSTARLIRENPTAGEFSLRLTLRAPQSPIASIDVCDVEHPRTALLRLSAENTGIAVSACDLDGHVTGPSREASFPFLPPALAQVRLEIRAEDSLVTSRRCLLVLRDADGHVVAEARVIE